MPEKKSIVGILMTVLDGRQQQEQNKTTRRDHSVPVENEHSDVDDTFSVHSLLFW